MKDAQPRPTTTDAGIPVESDEHSLTVGPDGPILLQDHYLIEHSAYTLHAEDDDWGQAGTMVREVLDDAARQRLVNNIVGHLLDGVTEPVLQRAFEYWHNVDTDLGDRVEKGVRAGQS